MTEMLRILNESPGILSAGMHNVAHAEALRMNALFDEDEAFREQLESDHDEALKINAMLNAKVAWNADADSNNQWGELGEDEQNDLINAARKTTMFGELYGVGIDALTDAADESGQHRYLTALRLIANQSCGPDWSPGDAAKFIKETALAAITKATKESA